MTHSIKTDIPGTLFTVDDHGKENGVFCFVVRNACEYDEYIHKLENSIASLSTWFYLYSRFS